MKEESPLSIRANEGMNKLEKGRREEVIPEDDTVGRQREFHVALGHHSLAYSHHYHLQLRRVCGGREMGIDGALVDLRTTHPPFPLVLCARTEDSTRCG